VRVIAATHQDLELRVAAGAFREDLFHRLNVIRLRLPALRERLDDVPVLVQHFMVHSAKQLGVEAKRVSALAMAQLSQFSFPGNVRQLENLCHWLTVMAPAQVVEVKDLPPEVLAGRSVPATALTTQPEAGPATQHAELMTSAQPAQMVASSGLDWPDQVRQEALTLLGGGSSQVWDHMTRKLESALIDAALMHTGGKRVEAASRLGIGRNTITRKIQELGLQAEP
jgi:two-component system nitrogen regulation response regulator GlnG